MSADHSSGDTFLSRRDLEEIGAGDGAPTECECCYKPGAPRRQSMHMGVTICFICAREHSEELLSEGSWA